MTENELPIPLNRLAFLQAYLYEIFSTEKKCENNFKYTKWFLNENYSENEIREIINFFNRQGVNCDCGVIKKLDLRDLLISKLIFHS